MHTAIVEESVALLPRRKAPSSGDEVGDEGIDGENRRIMQCRGSRGIMSYCKHCKHHLLSVFTIPLRQTTRAPSRLRIHQYGVEWVPIWPLFLYFHSIILLYAISVQWHHHLPNGARRVRPLLFRLTRRKQRRKTAPRMRDQQSLIARHFSRRQGQAWLDHIRKS